jgi:dihydroxy-acid dehydratase
MMFLPADERAIALWRVATAFNAGEPAVLASNFDTKAELLSETATPVNGIDAIRGYFENCLKESRGLIRAELASVKGTPALLLWKYAKGTAKTRFALFRVSRFRKGAIAKAYLDIRPAPLAEAQPSGLTPYDPVFRFDPKDCIRTPETAYTKDGGLSILYGQLAPEGSVVKTAGISAAFKQNCGPAFIFEGPCVVFESQEDACEGILAGKAKAGDIVIIRNEGPRGGPGMQEMLSPTSYIVGMGLGDKTVLITDGRFSGGTAGACIGHVSPEAAEGGPIGLLQNGDRLRVDFPNRKIDILVPEAELAERRKTYTPVKRPLSGWLARYQKLVSNASKGGILEG